MDVDVATYAAVSMKIAPVLQPALDRKYAKSMRSKPERGLAHTQSLLLENGESRPWGSSVLKEDTGVDDGCLGIRRPPRSASQCTRQRWPYRATSARADMHDTYVRTGPAAFRSSRRM